MTLTVDRINGSATLVDTLYNLNSNLFLITVQTTDDEVIDLKTEDSESVVGGVIESIMDDISPLAWFVPDDQSGQIFVVMDKAINDSLELQTRIRRIGLQSDGTTSIGPNQIDISGTLVVVASTISFT